MTRTDRIADLQKKLANGTAADPTRTAELIARYESMTDEQYSAAIRAARGQSTSQMVKSTRR